MAETDRHQLVKPATDNFIFEEEYTDEIYWGCFRKTVYVVIKQKTLYIYENKSNYLEQPGKPRLFFNLNYMNCLLGEDNL